MGVGGTFSRPSALVSTALQGGFANPVGGHLAAFVRVFSLFVLLGFVWGWSERLHLERVQSSARLEKAINRYALRQIGKAIVCGVLFGLFIYESGLFRSFKPWDAILGSVLLAAPVRILVGIFSRRNLKRKLSETR
jgi:hypothetical protein